MGRDFLGRSLGGNGERLPQARYGRFWGGQVREYLVLLGYGAGVKRVRRLIRLITVHQKSKTSIPYRNTSIIRTCCMTWPLLGLIMSGVRTSSMPHA